MSVRRVVKRTSSLVDRIVRPHVGVTILIYHRVGGGSDSAVDLDVDTFRAQLAHLAEHHRVISLSEAAEVLSAARSSNSALTSTDESARAQSAVVITFDDGTVDFCEMAMPALIDAGLPATLYLATDFVESGRSFPWGAPPTSWQALREAVATGLVTIGSHSHTHPLFDRIGVDVAADECDRSIGLIEDRLGLDPVHFAYPKAVRGRPPVERVVRDRFTSAALAVGRVNRPGRTDLHRLWRTPIQRTDGADEFAAKARGGMRLEGELRELVARYRYRGTTH